MSSATERFLIVLVYRAKSLVPEILGIWIYFEASCDPAIRADRLALGVAACAERFCKEPRQRLQIAPVALELDLHDALRLDVYLDCALPSAGDSHRADRDWQRHLGYLHRLRFLEGVRENSHEKSGSRVATGGYRRERVQ